MNTSKVCGKCKLPSDSSLFVKEKHRKDGLGVYCPPCRVKIQASTYQRNRDSILASSARRTERLKLEVFTHYCSGVSPSCQCCGENEIVFLVIIVIWQYGGVRFALIKLSERPNDYRYEIPLSRM